MCDVIICLTTRGAGDHEGQGGRLVPEGTPATGDVNVEYRPTYRQTHDVERERPCPFIKRFLFYLLMPLYTHRTVKVNWQLHHITLLYADAAKSNKRDYLNLNCAVQVSLHQSTSYSYSRLLVAYIT